jgi:hypothetical protein
LFFLWPRILQWFVINHKQTEFLFWEIVP